MAEGGTILLDEIGEISPLVQLKLLRFTEEKVIERVGEGKPVRIDVRLISATNKDLKALVAGGRFREDLYYRLRVLPIYLPPLRQRKDDIVLLVRHFVNRFRRTMAKAVEGPDERALAALLDYPWPGNVRELENAVEHAFVRCRTERFTPDDLPVEIRRPDLAIQALSLKNPPRKDEPADEPPAEPERERLSILRALEATGQRREQAADLLGLGRTTLWRKMKKLGIPAVSRPQDGGSRGPDPPTA
jgi:DNA-binding NtrC family response regulator